MAILVSPGKAPKGAPSTCRSGKWLMFAMFASVALISQDNNVIDIFVPSLSPLESLTNSQGQERQSAKPTTPELSRAPTSTVTLKAISYSLYGSNPKYTVGMINVATTLPRFFADWQAWIYHDNTVPNSTLQELQNVGHHVKLINVETDLPTWVHPRLNPMTWRFLIASNPAVDAYAVRDSDSLPSAREFAAVEEFLKSGKAFHFIRDHPMHNPQKFAPILGGMWGGVHRGVPHMDRLLKMWYSKKEKSTGYAYADDQDFLWTEIMPLAYQDVLQHDSYYCRESNAIAFPVSREESDADDNNPNFFVGNSFAQRNKPSRGSGKIGQAKKRYEECLQDRKTKETQLDKSGVKRGDFPSHFNTTFNGPIQGSSTDAWAVWSRQMKLD
ncbi:expressed unknown protein [Seminavis robusta]|uniref:Uncharacterized protein n=1 Tax=Seminavis robusta TaxID=568900 RepID=A0A9N8DVB0_9STRA|nr:expressed unknown protein [Seminavis robusta]|eukprot:Sro309_g113820.1 n/a (385) ;mRNA; f:42918-44072